jgi:type I restriction enzyme S subunit
MVDDWRLSTWENEVSLEYGKALPGGARACGRFRVYGSNGPIGWTDEPLVQESGVILGRKGAYRGVEYSPAPFHVIDTAYYVVPKSCMHKRWLYYAIKYYKLGEIDDGSPIPSTTRAAVYVRELRVPPLPEQRAIASVLGALDDKIDLNRRMCQTLEEMARALFKSWFVDFDPVRAKMEGRDPGLPKEIADLFPSRLVDSELGPIPEGWKFRSFDDVLTISREAIDPQDHVEEEFAHYSIPAFDSGMRAAIEKGASIKSQKLVVSDRHLLVSKLNPRTPRVWLPPQDGRRRQIASTEFIVCAPRPTSGYTRTILYHAAVSPSTIEFLAANATGTSNSHQRVRPADFLSYSFPSPSDKLLAAFTSIVEPLHARIAAARDESQVLTQTRDTLLPKLISGEVRVPASLGSMQEVAS